MLFDYFSCPSSSNSRCLVLIYLQSVAPQVVPVPRWSKSAPGKGYVGLPNNSSNEDLSNDVLQARLTCVIAAEPKPSIEWAREPANLTLVEGGQFRSLIKAVRPGLYHAVLYLNKPRDADMGKYYCKVSEAVWSKWFLSIMKTIVLTCFVLNTLLLVDWFLSKAMIKNCFIKFARESKRCFLLQIACP